jgi:hypothetical protein
MQIPALRERAGAERAIRDAFEARSGRRSGLVRHTDSTLGSHRSFWFSAYKDLRLAQQLLYSYIYIMSVCEMVAHPKMAMSARNESVLLDEAKLAHSAKHTAGAPW